MKGILLLLTLVLAASAPAFGAPTPAAQEEKVRITTGEWLPYLSSKLPHHGALAQLVTEAFAVAGVQVEFGYFPWPRGYQLMHEGEWDATMPYYCSSDRAQVSYCSVKLLDGEQVFFHLKSVPFDWNRVADLEEMPIGGVLGYFYGEDFDQAEKEGRLTVRRVAREETNFQLLVKGMIRVFPLDRQGGYDMLRSVLPPEQQALITHHPKPLHRESLHLLFPKGKPRSKQLLERFNAGFARLQEQGRVASYLNKMRKEHTFQSLQVDRQ